MADWHTSISVMPFSTQEGAEKDREACGAPVQGFTFFVGTNADEAMRTAKCIAYGIRTNPRVWQAEIIELKRVTP